MSDAPPAVLEVRTLALRRGRRRLAEAVDFSLLPGEYLELTGANGSGKSTLLRVLAGLHEMPAGARIERAADAGVFLFAARHGLRAELPVDAQLMLSLSAFDAAVTTSRVNELLREVGLERARNQRVGQLSEGQVRRLMLAAMIGSRRKVWLIDEPLNALDADGIKLLGRLLGQHLASGGAAVVATHQPLTSRLPELECRHGGSVHLAAGQALTHRTPHRADADSIRPAPHSPPPGLRWILRRELALVAARPQDALWPAIFHWMVVSLFPFGLGAESALLTRIAPGVFWVSALLASLLAAQRMFAPDHESGALDQMRISGVPLPMLAVGKLLANFTAIGLPMALASFPLGLQYGLGGATLGLLAGSMVLGLVTISALCALFAGLGLMARQAQVVVSLMAIPSFVPVLIFGTAAVGSVQSGLSASAPLMVLAALAVLSLIALPVVTARVLALALD